MPVQDQTIDRVVGNIFINAMRGVFKHHNQYTWDEDNTKSLIVIEECYPVDTSIIKAHPALLIEVGPMGWYARHIDQLLNWTWISHRIKNRPLAKKHGDFLRGNMVFHAVSREGLEARSIAFRVFTVLTTNRPYFGRRGIIEVGIPQMLPDTSIDNEWFVSSVMTNYLTMAKWDWVPEQGPLLNKSIVKEASIAT